jgi:opacity protein-like surface antigen
MRRTILVVATILVLALAASAHAESYIGVYGGYSLIPDADKEVGGTKGEAKYDSSYNVGGKLGYWAKTLPWVAVELNAWNTWANGKDSGDDINALNFSGSVLLQYLCNPLRAYAGGGVLGTWADPKNDDLDDDFAIGAMGQAGLEYLIGYNLGVFTEYRYSFNSFELKNKVTDVKTEVDLTRHEFMAGVNLRF